MRIAIEAFRGVRPRLDPRLLDPKEAQVAENCRLWSGALGSWRKSLNLYSGATNSLLFSERFDNVAWTPNALTDVQANVTTAPDGTNLADKLRENTSNAVHFVVQAITKGAGVQQWTGAVSLKQAERTFGFIQLDDTGGNLARIIVNLATGAITQQSATGMTIGAVRVDAEANGFYRLHLPVTTTAGATLRQLHGPALNGTTISYAGTTNSGVYAFAASLRPKNKPGPYTATEGTAFTVVPVNFYLFKQLYWFLYPEPTYTEKAPYAGDTVDITAFTRVSSPPQYTYSPQAEDTTLRTVMPRHSWTLGLPSPAAPPLATLAPRTGNITALTTTLGTAATNTTTSFTISGITPDGSTVRASCTFQVTVPAGTQRSGRVVFRISRSGVSIATAEVPINIPAGSSNVVIPYSLEGDDTSYPGGALTYTFSATVTPDAGGTFGAVTYSHTLANVRYPKTLVTSAAHNLVKGGAVSIAAVVGAEALNGIGLNILDVPNANTFWVDRDAKGQTYVSGGTWTEVFNAGETQDTAYVLTFLCTLGAITFEGPPSDASNIIARGETERVNLTALATAAPVDGNTYQVTGKRLYRTNANSDGLNAVYQFVAEIPLANTTFTDSLRSFELGEELPSKDWVRPPADMTGIVSVTNGVLAGFSKNIVCFCEPYQPHAWPLKYQLALDAQVVALCAVGNATAVLTRGRPAMVYGTTPGQMRVERSQVANPCLSAQSVADMGYGVVYASDNGLVLMSGSGEKNITSGLFTKGEWQSYNPATIIGSAYDDRYVGFYTKDDGSKGGFVLDPQNELQSWALLDFGADAVWTDPETGDFYVLIDEYIARFNAHPTDVYFYLWRSKRFGTPLSGNFSHAKLIADAYPIDFTAYGNTDPRFPDQLVQLYSKTVTNGLAFPMPAGFRCTAFEFEFRGRGDGKLKNFVVASSLDELNQNG